MDEKAGVWAVAAGGDASTRDMWPSRWEQRLLGYKQGWYEGMMVKR